MGEYLVASKVIGSLVYCESDTLDLVATEAASTIDGRRKGACLFCQEYFMDLYLLAELKTISLKVTTVDMQKPPPDFR
uniref:CLIC N-terminal domain-containing protein n=1 Tax=Timema genevievae TaxID=629358 RepID=A0A7R9JMY7_TIMGE|nr:unnamed protein product [Timema genevievae]